MEMSRRWIEWQELWRAAVIAFAFSRRMQTPFHNRAGDAAEPLGLFVIFNPRAFDNARGHDASCPRACAPEPTSGRTNDGLRR